MPVTETKSAPQISDITIDNYKPQEGFLIVFVQKIFLKKLSEDGEIPALDRRTFFAGVLAFYSEAFSYGVEKRCINDFILKHSLFPDISKREYVSIDDVLFFVDSFI